MKRERKDARALDDDVESNKDISGRRPCIRGVAVLAGRTKKRIYNKSVSTQIMGRNMVVSKQNIKSLTFRFCPRYTGTRESSFRDLICMEMREILLCATLLTLATYFALKFFPRCLNEYGKILVYYVNIKKSTILIPFDFIYFYFLPIWKIKVTHTVRVMI